ncbi:UNKNOWN [Stylonychia lemnae]|uniref:Uncharacterized protein n=1 Tax=Stylonychia lemnae TaxID=5949 RepID=A0A078B0C8_STYLE|nr:UNKNOWN [Stylonychia lemnae]|eukprot:CDW87964.1 UNKNOWN [Stylonychia lemnae]
MSALFFQSEPQLLHQQKLNFNMVNPLKLKMSFKFHDDLLTLQKSDLLQLVSERQNQTNLEMLKRFDLKDLLVYPHQQYDGQHTGWGTVVSLRKNNMQSVQQRENKNLASWINKVGGRVKFSINDELNIVIVEQQKIEQIIDHFLRWRLNHSENYENRQIQLNQRPKKHQDLTQIQNSQNLTKILPRNQRQMQLLGQRTTVNSLLNIEKGFNHADRSQSVADFPQVEIQLFDANKQKQATIEQSFMKNMSLDERLKGPNSLSNRQNYNSLQECMQNAFKQEPDEVKRDIELLNLIITNTEVFISDIELMFKCIQKYYYFTAEFHMKKKLPVSQSQIPHVFCFTSKYKPENHVHKPHLYQGSHIFESKIVNQTQLLAQGILPQQVKIIQLLPTYQHRAPLGSSVFLDPEEFRHVEKDRIQKEQCYIKHVERLKKKKLDLYDIKTPIPANPNRCFVCEDQINDGYKEHLKSESHLMCIRNQPLYNEIDNLIDQMNEELLLDEKQKKKRGRRKGGKQAQDDENCKEESDLFHNQSQGEQLGMGNTQEMTNINFMSTEVTIAKQIHKRKNKIPIYVGQEMIELDRNTIEQKRIMQMKNLQMQQSFLQPAVLQKRKRVQILEEEKEDQKQIIAQKRIENTIKNEIGHYQAVEIDKNLGTNLNERIYYQAPRKYLTKTRKQIKDQNQQQSQSLDNQIDIIQQQQV